MKLCSRLILRIKEEGLLCTVIYVIYTAFYCSREFICDTFLDLRYSGRLLRGNLETHYGHLGSNDVYHSKYSALAIIFRLIPITEKDVLVDVGCGKGRVINYWLSRKLKNKIIGLELDERIAANTAAQFAGQNNVRIISGNAIHNIPEDGTIFYFYNPFSEEVVRQFEETMSRMFAGKQIRIIYYNPKSVHVFQNGKWLIKYINFEKDLGYKRWGRINKYHDLALLRKKGSHDNRA